MKLHEFLDAGDFYSFEEVGIEFVRLDEDEKPMGSASLVTIYNRFDVSNYAFSILKDIEIDGFSIEQKKTFGHEWYCLTLRIAPDDHIEAMKNLQEAYERDAIHIAEVRTTLTETIDRIIKRLYPIVDNRLVFFYNSYYQECYYAVVADNIPPRFQEELNDGILDIYNDNSLIKLSLEEIKARIDSMSKDCLMGMDFYDLELALYFENKDLEFIDPSVDETGLD